MTLTAHELAEMRSAMGGYLPDTCSILSPHLTDDGMGGKTLTWQVKASGVPCRVEALSGNERYSADKVTVFARYRIAVPHDTQVTEADRLQVGDTVYRVLFVDRGQSWQLVKRLEVERVE